METVQSEALSTILAEMATKTDLERLKTEFTWCRFAVVGLFGKVITLLNAATW